jgi:GH43 family beta-xylosidase
LMLEGKKIIFWLVVLLTASPCWSQTFKNPIRASGPDPFVVYYNGYYYLTFTSNYAKHPGGSAIEIVRTQTVAHMSKAEPVAVWQDSARERSSNMWAPELHRLKGPDGLRWYLYYTAGPSACCTGQRIHVLESSGDDPMGPYVYKSQLTEEYAIDGSIMIVDDKLYFLYCQAKEGNHVHVAPMSTPYSLSGPGVRIASPAYPWEKIAGYVNEAPNALIRNGKIFVAYSFNDCSSGSYGVGMLTADKGSDLLDPSSWRKLSQPFLQGSAPRGVHGPGHTCFFQSPDGTEDWIAYHANNNANDGCNDKRAPRIQRVYWKTDGIPFVGEPVSVSQPLTLPSGDSGNGLFNASLGVVNTKTRLETFPNPTDEWLSVYFVSGKDEELHVKVHDQQGKVVTSLYEGSATASIPMIWEVNVGQWPEGLYTVHVIHSASIITRKIFIKRGF